MKVFVSCDGDGIGAQVGKAGLSNNIEAMSSISNAIKKATAHLESWVIANDGIVIMSGGDECTFQIEDSKIVDLPKIREEWAEFAKATLSMGIGKELAQAGIALMWAKLNGKDQIAIFDEDKYEKVMEIMTKEQSEKDKLQEAYFKAEKEDDWLHHLVNGGKDEEEEQMSYSAESKKEDLESKDDSKESEEKEEGSEEEQNSEDSKFPNKESEEDGESDGESDEGMEEDKEGLDAKGNEESEEDGIAEETEEQPQEESENSLGNPEEIKSRMREMIGNALLSMKDRAGDLEQIKQSNPDLYTALFNLVESVKSMAQELLSGGKQPQDDKFVDQDAGNEELGEEAIDGKEDQKLPGQEVDGQEDQEDAQGIENEMKEDAEESDGESDEEASKDQEMPGQPKQDMAVKPKQDMKEIKDQPKEEGKEEKKKFPFQKSERKQAFDTLVFKILEK